MNHSTSLRIHEEAARRLRTEYPRDFALRALLAIDLAVRRVAARLLGLPVAHDRTVRAAHRTGRI
jgi:hypothetical protein